RSVRPAPSTTLFPYTTLFRSREEEDETRPRQLVAPHRDAEGRVEASVLEQRLARDERDGVRRRRGEPGDAACVLPRRVEPQVVRDRKSTRLNSSHVSISYAVF